MIVTATYSANHFLYSLDDNASIPDIPLKGMRIGINGREANVGQVFQNLDTQLTQADYYPGQGQPLSTLGTIIPSGERGWEWMSFS